MNTGLQSAYVRAKSPRSMHLKIPPILMSLVWWLHYMYIYIYKQGDIYGPQITNHGPQISYLLHR